MWQEHEMATCTWNLHNFEVQKTWRDTVSRRPNLGHGGLGGKTTCGKLQVEPFYSLHPQVEGDGMLILCFSSFLFQECCVIVLMLSGCYLFGGDGASKYPNLPGCGCFSSAQLDSPGSASTLWWVRLAAPKSGNMRCIWWGFNKSTKYKPMRYLSLRNYRWGWQIKPWQDGSGKSWGEDVGRIFWM